MTTDGELRVEAIVFMNRALLGMVTPELRGVSISVGDNVVRSRMVYDHEPTEDECELVSEVETEMLADYLPEVEVVVGAEAVPPPAWPELLPGESWVYRRREPEPIEGM